MLRPTTLNDQLTDPLAREEARSMEGIRRNAKATRESLLPAGGPEDGSRPAARPRSVPGRADEGATPTYFAKPHLDEMGHDPTTPANAKTLFRRNTLDEMTVGRTEKPVTGHVPEKPDGEARYAKRSNRSSESIAATNARSASEGQKGTQRFSPLLEGQPERDDVRPLVRGKTGVGSYEDPGEQKRKGRTKGKTGRPGR